MSQAIAIPKTAPLPQALVLPDPKNKAQVQHYYGQTVAAWLKQYQTSGEVAVSNLMGAMAAKHMVGYACLLLKEECDHGEFLKLRAEHFPTLKERTVAEWQARAERDVAASTALKGATVLLLNAPGHDDTLRKYSEVANAYFRSKSTLLKQGAGEIGLLGYRKPSEPTGPRTKTARGTKADLARKEFETKSKLCFETLTREAEKAATLKQGDAYCWDVETTDDDLTRLDQSLALIRAGLKASLERRKALAKKARK